MSEEFNLQLFAHEKTHVLQFGCIDESATAHRHAQKYRLQSVTDSDAGVHRHGAPPVKKPPLTKALTGLLIFTAKRACSLD
jgi:hypothetical protein